MMVRRSGGVQMNVSGMSGPVSHYSHNSQSPSDTVMRKMRHKGPRGQTEPKILHLLSNPYPEITPSCYLEYFKKFSWFFPRALSKAVLGTVFPLHIKGTSTLKVLLTILQYQRQTHGQTDIVTSWAPVGTKKRAINFSCRLNSFRLFVTNFSRDSIVTML